ncbi:T9SS type A sorting domain-containing protein [Hymenobacter siberiensis]|uniref:T9SS type A sorting domain-containing protein n=1 Tax=Hymenobacter siberiensis TaxID=2848396 RepID=UPI001C1E0A0F
MGGTSTLSPVVAMGPGVVAPVLLYPNPARERLLITGVAATAYRMHNHLGQLLRQGNMPAGPATVELGGLPGGLYHLELETASGPVRRTFARE